jgi:predicted alpha-1,6-mannanase (GH76 family)
MRISSVACSVLGLAGTGCSYSQYDSNAKDGLNTLQTWYNVTSGLWDTTGWWNSANCITVLGDLAAIDVSVKWTVMNVFANTFSQAQKHNLQMKKVILPNFNYHSFYQDFPIGMLLPQTFNPAGFLNDYYDDEGWWALAWIQAYDVTYNPSYLIMAQDIFADMKKGSTTPCGGGIWWDKDHTYVNAIANELYLSVAAHLANRIPLNRDYLNTAKSQWKWFQQSGMINSQNLINDGLTTECVNNGQTVWSYNQGVIIGALVELAAATRDSAYLNTAKNIATAAITALSDSNNILHDPCEPNCGADGAQFKGVFMRNLQKLQQVAPNKAYLRFITANAQSIWANDRDDRTNELSVNWAGPFVAPANASTQSSALDALVAAVAVGGAVLG